MDAERTGHVVAILETTMDLLIKQQLFLKGIAGAIKDLSTLPGKSDDSFAVSVLQGMAELTLNTMDEEGQELRKATVLIVVAKKLLRDNVT